jgi:hypothetical protein
MIDVAGDESLKLVLVPDDGSVEKLAADRADPSFSEGVGHRCSDRCFEDLESFGSEHLVEGGGELAATISRTRARAPARLPAWAMNRLRRLGWSTLRWGWW